LSSDIYNLSAVELIKSYANKNLSPVEVTKNIIQRVKAIDKKINSYVFIDEQNAIEEAEKSEKRWMQNSPKGKLDGVPTSIKDLLLTKDWPTLRGSKTVDKNIDWADDSPVVARLKEAGAVLLGKTTTPEFGHRGTTQSPLTGITRNPWNLDCTSGGSSGGSASAVASGMGPLSIGTDGGGSVRIPCSFSGLFGIKPTFGKIPAWPLSPFGTIANLGPMTRSVMDGALLFSVISSPDWRDWHADTKIDSDFVEKLSEDIKGKKIAYCPDFGMKYAMNPNTIQTEVAEIVKNTVKLLEDSGAEVDQIEIEWASDPKKAFHILWTSGAAFLSRNFSEKQMQILDPVFRKFCEIGSQHSLFDRLEAEASRGSNGMVINKIFQKYDYIVGPTMPTTAFQADKLVPEGWGEDLFAWTPFTYPFNMTCHPAVSVNCGFSNGLPVGFHIIAKAHEDGEAFVCAAAVEKIADLLGEWPSL